ncbi:hypothetical protein [Bosea beijingensis]|nr:hypothetical protein [Bosea sp. REN20]
MLTPLADKAVFLKSGAVDRSYGICGGKAASTSPILLNAGIYVVERE